jgi:hypothetical protein
MYLLNEIGVLPMNKELEELKQRIVEKELLIDIEEIDILLNLFNEMKMVFSDWKRMKELAILNRKYRLEEINDKVIKDLLEGK